MKILGDIGNTETKIFLVSQSNKILKKKTFLSKNLSQKKLNKFFNNFKLNYKNIKKILFCSVVPRSFNLIKNFLSKKTKIKCYEVKKLDLKSLINIASVQSNWLIPSQTLSLKDMGLKQRLAMSINLWKTNPCSCIKI